MTDITELAQREKFEAWARSQKLGLSYGDCGYVFSSTEMAWRAWMASSSELVEALEKAQQRNGELETYSKTAIEFREAARDENRHLKLELEIAEKRIAELESRTVTVENLQESAYRAGLTAGWNLGLANNNEGFNKCLAAHTAGFKVKAE
ncbi:hypothetical protein [Klebsiella pneumoniae]|uniref:hypothetical protein n=1 Tax=Klebsiella pneumoniae TaxID=573 RepID=UPI0010F503A6|nr:hypothetical protein [Klebsiella pneumoniae]